jgi:hypothetical protein
MEENNESLSDRPHSNPQHPVFSFSSGSHRFFDKKEKN